MYTTAKVYAKGNCSQVTKGIELCQTYLSDLTSDEVILDLGCGTGEITQYLATKTAAKVTGLDKSADMIQHAIKNNNKENNICYEVVDLQHSDWFQKPERQELYTTAVSFYVFHWIHDLKAALQNIYKVLSPGGRFLVNHSFNPKVSDWNILPKLTSKPKWKTLLNQVDFTWQLPYHRTLYEDGAYKWMENTSDLEDLITSVGFSISFMKTCSEFVDSEPDTFRPLLPVLTYLSEEKQDEFIKEFMDNKTSLEDVCITYMLTKNR